jgi:hypothetical protein
VFPQDQKKKVDGGTKVKDESDAICLYCAGLFFEDHDSEEWVQCQKCLQSAHTLCERASGCVCVCACVRVTRNDMQLFIVETKCYNNFILQY